MSSLSSCLNLKISKKTKQKNSGVVLKNSNNFWWHSIDKPSWSFSWFTVNTLFGSIASFFLSPAQYLSIYLYTYWWWWGLKLLICSKPHHRLLFTFVRSSFCWFSRFEVSKLLSSWKKKCRRNKKPSWDPANEFGSNNLVSHKRYARNEKQNEKKQIIKRRHTKEEKRETKTRERCLSFVPIFFLLSLPLVSSVCCFPPFLIEILVCACWYGLISIFVAFFLLFSSVLIFTFLWFSLSLSFSGSVIFLSLSLLRYFLVIFSLFFPSFVTSPAPPRPSSVFLFLNSVRFLLVWNPLIQGVEQGCS